VELPHDAVKEFRERGFHLLRGFFSEEKAGAAAQWLKAQNHEKLAKTWTEQEPAVPLAVLTRIHTDETPIAELATDERMLKIAAELIGDDVYIWASKVNLKAAWCGTVEYYHQDLVYWKDRGYPKDEMLSCMIFLEPHGPENGGLNIFPGSHAKGFIEHQPFININGLAKYMVPPEKLNELKDRHGFESIKANPGDVLFFHTSLVHGSSHNSSPQSRMIILSQLNTVGNEPGEVKKNARDFNLRRSKMEMDEAQRRLTWFKKKYEDQKAATDDVTFCAPIPDEESSYDK
jgi:ectoine hydroxylase